MKELLALSTLSTLLLFFNTKTLAIEEAAYTQLSRQDNFEIRRYDAHIRAVVIVDGTLESSGSKAFRPLFNYISGNNKLKENSVITAPASIKDTGVKIAMTAPVSQSQASQGQWEVSFTMPTQYTMGTLPAPSNERVTLVEIPEQTVASIRYSGNWSEKKYRKHKLKLEEWIKINNHNAIGQAFWARYNAPYTPWFLRRNEILIPIDFVSNANQN
jgi:hypothetical protein